MNVPPLKLTVALRKEFNTEDDRGSRRSRRQDSALRAQHVHLFSEALDFTPWLDPSSPDYPVAGTWLSDRPATEDCNPEQGVQSRNGNTSASTGPMPFDRAFSSRGNGGSAPNRATRPRSRAARVAESHRSQTRKDALPPFSRQTSASYTTAQSRALASWFDPTAPGTHRLQQRLAGGPAQQRVNRQGQSQPPVWPFLVGAGQVHTTP